MLFRSWGTTGWDGYETELRDVAGRARGCDTLIAVDGAAVLGTVGVVPPGSPMRKIDDPHAFEIRMLAVDPPAQRQGVARTLLGACSDRARAAQLRLLVLQSDEDLPAAHRLYDAVGFVRRTDLDVTVDDGYRALGFELDLLSGRRPTVGR